MSGTFLALYHPSLLCSISNSFQTMIHTTYGILHSTRCYSNLYFTLAGLCVIMLQRQRLASAGDVRTGTQDQHSVHSSFTCILDVNLMRCAECTALHNTQWNCYSIFICCIFPESAGSRSVTINNMRRYNVGWCLAQGHSFFGMAVWQWIKQSCRIMPYYVTRLNYR